MRETLANIKALAMEQIAADGADLDALRVKYLGKKGELTAVLRGMGALSPEERPVVGALANEVRAEIEAALSARVAAEKEQALEAQLARETLDVTMPGNTARMGHQHPLTRAQREMEEIFIGMGFEIAEGPEVEYDYYNFKALNIPENHPARDTQDTFYITDNVLLRSQTSPVQVRVMEKQNPPIRVISPGRVYRSDALDATHSPLFHFPYGLNQQVCIPTARPPAISELRLSPIIMVSSFFIPPIISKSLSKKTGDGLLAPRSSEIKIPSTISLSPALFVRPFCTCAVPFDAI